ncbi:hypothetical protein BCR33DRAFT_786888 [Rhizoclosmatium globosum]|uniref:Uncharacterized protein n=1 Tax=Rhizoclosmatium globosum TaxID=329046 RepID=A0A1Y2C3X6_9FUNG|nr:hypothetical protein BCR33DRAFT_786888 [Rhizoclosmatium globosum]|eukprot:ORY41656.1 hypothetical protein BCR33DRAFT_786888 [Rhizoclosmatium globosum]
MTLKMEDVAHNIPVEPTPREFIEPHFVGARAMLRNMTCLAHRSEDIDILFECYIEYVMYCTKQVTVEECPTRYRQICQLQDQLVEACVSVEDQNDVQQLFVAIRMNYIDLPH